MSSPAGRTGMRCVDKNQCFEGKFWPSYVVNPSRNDHRLHVECGRTQYSWTQPRDGLSAQVREVLAEPAIIERLGAAGMLARSSTPAAFAAEIAEHRTRWAALAREFGVGPPRG